MYLFVAMTRQDGAAHGLYAAFSFAARSLSLVALSSYFFFSAGVTCFHISPAESTAAQVEVHQSMWAR